MKKFDKLSEDEIAMRAFYEMCGISDATTDAAIKMRREHPVELEKEVSRIKHGRPQKQTVRQEAGRTSKRSD